MSQLTGTEPYGVLSFRFSNLEPLNFEKYFSCLDLIRPLFENTFFIASTSGYYLNYTDECVRLTYFTNNITETKKAISNFLERNNCIKLFNFKEPRAGNIAENYGGDNLRFRKFLSTYTQIGLDLLDFDILYSRRLVAEYRLTYSTQKISCRPLFEPAFSKHSKFFGQLDTQLVEQIWKDLDFWHPLSSRKSERVADWAHFIVNMLLPGDYFYLRNYEDFFTDPKAAAPITGQQKKKMLGLFNIDIPDNWNFDD